MADYSDFRDKDTKFTGTGGERITPGTTGERVNTGGTLRFNTSLGLMEYYDGTQWKSIDSPPVVTAITPTNVASADGSTTTFAISGSGFSTTGVTVVTFIGNDNSEFNASSVTVNNVSSITATRTSSSFINAKEPYDVEVTNPSGLAATLADVIFIDNPLSFTTSAGTLGSGTGGTSVSFTVAATDPDSDTITYAVKSGDSLPAGLSLNSSTGVISGTATEPASSTTTTFTIQATASGVTVERSFSITINPPPVNIQYLVVAGGGGGGGPQYHSGGGGAGGVRFDTTTGVSVAKGTVLTATVGGGGVVIGDGQGPDGLSSSITGPQFSTIAASAGGGGGHYASNPGRTGGSGGGAGAYNASGGSGNAGGYSPSEGNPGGNTATGAPHYGGAGGGGAGGSGSDGNPSFGGPGGNGVQVSITGSAIYYGGGGGGSTYQGGSPGSGGQGGGGSGSTAAAPSGQANTGGGGGGNERNGGIGGNGGSGIVILKMLTSKYTGTTTGSPTVTTDGSNTIIKFTGTGSYTV